jgi:hypothetical protein
VVISAKKDYVVNVIVGNKLQQFIPLSPITANPGFAAVVSYFVNRDEMAMSFQRSPSVCGRKSVFCGSVET